MGVVEPLDVAEDGGRQLGPRLPLVSVEQLGLERGEKAALRVGVGRAGSDSWRHFGDGGMMCSRKQAPDADAAGTCHTYPAARRPRCSGLTFWDASRLLGAERISNIDRGVSSPAGNRRLDWAVLCLTQLAWGDVPECCGSRASAEGDAPRHHLGPNLANGAVRVDTHSASLRESSPAGAYGTR